MSTLEIRGGGVMLLDGEEIGRATFSKPFVERDVLKEFFDGERRQEIWEDAESDAWDEGYSEGFCEAKDAILRVIDQVGAGAFSLADLRAAVVAVRE